MASEVDRREHAGQLEGFDTVDYADVEEAVVHLGAGGDLHASAVGRSVGEGGEEGGLGFLNRPFSLWAGCGAGHEDFQGERGEPEHGWGEGEGVAAVSPKPAWQVVGAARDFGVQAHAGYAAKVPSAES